VVFYTSTQLNILCTSVATVHNAKNNNSPFTWSVYQSIDHQSKKNLTADI